MGYAHQCKPSPKWGISGNREVHYRARRPPGPNDAFGGSRDLGEAQEHVDDGNVVRSEHGDGLRVVGVLKHEAF